MPRPLPHRFQYQKKSWGFSSAKKNVFTQKYDEIRRFDGTEASLTFINKELLPMQAESLALLGAVNLRRGGAVDVKVAS